MLLVWLCPHHCFQNFQQIWSDIAYGQCHEQKQSNLFDNSLDKRQCRSRLEHRNLELYCYGSLSKNQESLICYWKRWRISLLLLHSPHNIFGAQNLIIPYCLWDTMFLQANRSNHHRKGTLRLLWPTSCRKATMHHHRATHLKRDHNTQVPWQFLWSFL